MRSTGSWRAIARRSSRQMHNHHVAAQATSTAIASLGRRSRRSGGWIADLPDRLFLSSPLCKNIPVLGRPKSDLCPLPSRPTGGAYRDRHGRGAGCGGRGSVRRVVESQGGLISVSEHLARKTTALYLLPPLLKLRRDAALELEGLARACRVEALAKTEASPRTVKLCGPDAWRLASSLAEARSA
jgi:hypothetical protein